MKVTVTMALLLLLLLLAATIGTCRAVPFKGTRTYNLESDVDRYGRYERVLVGLKSSEGLKLDPAVLEEVRQVLLQEERQETGKAHQRYRTVDVHLGSPLQSRHIAELLYRARLRGPASGHQRTK